MIRETSGSRRSAAGEERRLLRLELQSATEAYEATNEELKAAHEEATSMNEELQSANEELETSKEELQSINEELTTVNSQLQAKIVAARGDHQRPREPAEQHRHRRGVPRLEVPRAALHAGGHRSARTHRYRRRPAGHRPRAEIHRRQPVVRCPQRCFNTWCRSNAKSQATAAAGICAARCPIAPPRITSKAWSSPSSTSRASKRSEDRSAQGARTRTGRVRTDAHRRGHRRSTRRQIAVRQPQGLEPLRHESADARSG